MVLDVPRSDDTDMLVLLPLPGIRIRPLLRRRQLSLDRSLTLGILRRHIGYNMRWGGCVPQL